MTGLRLSLIFVVVLVFDGLVLPAFFGARESFLSLLFLVAPILYLGPSRRGIACGLFFVFILELFRGFELGTLAIPFLVTAAAMCLIQKVLDMKYTYETRFNSVRLFFLALATSVFTYAFLFLYGRGHVNADYFDPVAGLTMALEALALIFIFNAVFSKKSDYS